MIELLLFDMDDTLYPERDFVLSGFKAVSSYVAKEYGVEYDGFFSCLKRSFDDHGRGRNFNDAINEFDLGKDCLTLLVDVYRSHSPDIRLRSDIDNFLIHLSGRIPLCLITDGWVEVQKMKVRALGLNRHFERIIFSQQDGLEFAKPHPRFFKKALDYFGVGPENALMIGDNYDKDIMGARKMGIKTFQVFDLLSDQEQSRLLNKLDLS